MTNCYAHTSIGWIRIATALLLPVCCGAHDRSLLVPFESGRWPIRLLDSSQKSHSSFAGLEPPQRNRPAQALPIRLDTKELIGSFATTTAAATKHY